MCASTLNLREATPILLATKKNTYKDIQQLLASSPIAGLWQKNLQVPLHRTPRAVSQKPNNICIEFHHGYYILSAL